MAKNAPVKPLTEEEFRSVYKYEPDPKTNYWKLFKEECLCSKRTVFNLFPIFEWLPKYKPKTDLLGDLLAGITVAIMHIPHGLAYSQLGGVPPVIGLYMAVFPTIVYIIMGTSRHISLGTFAVVCAMAGDIVAEFTEENSTPEECIQIASAVGLTVGLWQVSLSLLRLGSLNVYMSNALVSGFTTGAAFHVFTYQFKNLLGIQLKRFSGTLKLVYTYIDLFEKITDTNIVTMSISICFIAFLVLFNYGVKPLLHKKCPKFRVPIPIELIAVAIGIIISYYLELNQIYDVKIVNSVPKGLPVPELPSLAIIPKIIISSFSLAVVALSVNLSLSKIFSKKDGYEISSKEEILAYGCANVFSSFFQCLPSTASLSRSVLQYSSGGKTQIAGLFSAIIMIFILLFIGPIFEPVPYCVLSSIVLVTILGLLLQARDLPNIYRLSFLDGSVWLITFLTVVVVDIDIGLLLGFITSVGSVLFLNHRTQYISMGQVSGHNLYLDIKHFKTADAISNISIVKLIGGLNFSNEETMHKRILRIAAEGSVNQEMKYSGAVILDFSSVSYIDPTASNSLLFLWKDLKGKQFRMFLANCNVKVYRDLEHSGFFNKFPKEHVLATVDDAVVFATKIDVVVDSGPHT